MLFDLKIGQRQFAFITAYKPPSVDNNTFKRELCDLLDEVLDAHAPKITFKNRPSPAGVFITDEIRKTMQNRDKQKKRYYRFRNPLEWEKYRVLRNKVVSMRRKAVQDHFKTLCKEIYADQRKFLNTIRPYINSRKKKNNSRIVLKENDQITREPREVAETLNDFFSNIVGTDNTTERMKDFTHFPHDSASGQITLNYTSPNEVNRASDRMRWCGSA